MTVWSRRQHPGQAQDAAPLADSAMLARHFLGGWTEDFFVSGYAQGDGRLSDLLNARRPVQVTEPKVRGTRAGGWPARPNAEITIDPFDFELVLGHALNSAWQPVAQARRIHKVRYPVRVRGDGFDLTGTIHLFAGNSPEHAFHRTGQLFLPITGAVVRRDGRLVSDRFTDVVLVNRYAIRTIQQLDSPVVH